MVGRSRRTTTPRRRSPRGFEASSSSAMAAASSAAAAEAQSDPPPSRRSTRGRGKAAAKPAAAVARTKGTRTSSRKRKKQEEGKEQDDGDHSESPEASESEDGRDSADSSRIGEGSKEHDVTVAGHQVSDVVESDKKTKEAEQAKPKNAVDTRAKRVSSRIRNRTEGSEKQCSVADETKAEDAIDVSGERGKDEAVVEDPVCDSIDAKAEEQVIPSNGEKETAKAETTGGDSSSDRKVELKDKEGNEQTGGDTGVNSLVEESTWRKDATMVKAGASNIDDVTGDGQQEPIQNEKQPDSFSNKRVPGMALQETEKEGAADYARGTPMNVGGPGRDSCKSENDAPEPSAQPDHGATVGADETNRTEETGIEADQSVRAAPSDEAKQRTLEQAQKSPVDDPKGGKAATETGVRHLPVSNTPREDIAGEVDVVDSRTPIPKISEVAEQVAPKTTSRTDIVPEQKAPVAPQVDAEIPFTKDNSGSKEEQMAHGPQAVDKRSAAETSGAEKEPPMAASSAINDVPGADPPGQIPANKSMTKDVVAAKVDDADRPVVPHLSAPGRRIEGSKTDPVGRLDESKSTPSISLNVGKQVAKAREETEVPTKSVPGSAQSVTQKYGTDAVSAGDILERAARQVTEESRSTILAAVDTTAKIKTTVKDERAIQGHTKALDPEIQISSGPAQDVPPDAPILSARQHQRQSDAIEGKSTSVSKSPDISSRGGNAHGGRKGDTSIETNGSSRALPHEKSVTDEKSMSITAEPASATQNMPLGEPKAMPSSEGIRFASEATTGLIDTTGLRSHKRPRTAGESMVKSEARDEVEDGKAGKDEHRPFLVQKPRLNLERIKMMIFSAGSIVHGRPGYERLFAEYWAALSMRIEGQLSSANSRRCRAALESFLTTKKLRKLHNKLIMGLLERCAHPVTPMDDVSCAVPSVWRGRVKLLSKGPSSYVRKAKQSIHEARRKDQSTIIGDLNWHRSYAPVFSEQESRPIVGSIRPTGSALAIPGAITVDPRVRELAQSAGMKVSEPAVWLLVVAMKEYTKALLKSTIAADRAMEAGQAPPRPSIHSQVLSKPKLVSQPEHIPPVVSQPGQAKILTNLDIHALMTSLPMGAIGSPGGCVSRITFERGLFASKDNSLVTGGKAFDELRRFVSASIAPPPPKRQKIDVQMAASAPASQKTSAEATKGMKSTHAGGLGRGAKDLAALKARSSVTAKNTGGGTPPVAATIGAATGPQPPAADIACPTPAFAPLQAPILPNGGPASAPIASSGPGSSPTEAQPQAVALPRLGKGFGVKNLAAMRARSLTLGEGEAAKPPVDSGPPAAFDPPLPREHGPPAGAPSTSMFPAPVPAVHHVAPMPAAHHLAPTPAHLAPMPLATVDKMPAVQAKMEDIPVSSSSGRTDKKAPS